MIMTMSMMGILYRWGWAETWLANEDPRASSAWCNNISLIYRTAWRIHLWVTGVTMVGRAPPALNVPTRRGRGPWEAVELQQLGKTWTPPLKFTSVRIVLIPPILLQTSSIIWERIRVKSHFHALTAPTEQIREPTSECTCVLTQGRSHMPVPSAPIDPLGRMP